MPSKNTILVFNGERCTAPRSANCQRL